MLPRDGLDIFRLSMPPIAGTRWLFSFLEGLLSGVSGEARSKGTRYAL